MTRFFTSDTHFSHKNIIAYSDRPFKDIYHMDAELVRRWNELVTPTDVVYHLGDVAMGDSTRWHDILTSLNGYKVLSIGNHDRIFAGMSRSQQDKWSEKYYEWFDDVDTAHQVLLSDGAVVNLSHFPYTGDSQEADRYDEHRLLDDGTPLIHGHTHRVLDPANPLASRVSFSARGTRQVHVGVDSWEFRPVPESEVIELLNVTV